MFLTLLITVIYHLQAPALYQGAARDWQGQDPWLLSENSSAPSHPATSFSHKISPWEPFISNSFHICLLNCNTMSCPQNHACPCKQVRGGVTARLSASKAHG